MKITIEHGITDEKKKNLGINAWLDWSCKVSQFPYRYDTDEVCYIHKGRVVVSTPFETVELNAGDLAMFPKGLESIWDIQEDLRKVFKF